VVVLFRPDAMVKIVDVPPVPEKELAALLRYRIRSLYPGKPETVALDYTLLSGGEGKTATVYLMEETIIGECRRLCGPARLVLPCLLLDEAARREPDIGEILCLHGEWMERLSYSAGILVESRVVRRSQELCGDLAELGFSAEGDGERIVVVRIVPSGAGEEDALRDCFPRRVLSFVSLEEICGGRFRGAGLFRSKKKSFFRDRKKRMFLWGVLVTALFFAVLGKRLAFAEKTYRILKERYTGLERESLAARDLERKQEELRKTLSSLRSKGSPDVYRLFGELSSAFAGEVEIVSFSLKGVSFQFEGRAENPLDIVRRLEKNPGFSGVRVHSVLPFQGEKKRFFLSGVYRAE
jgi:hypothetical protein